MGDNGSTWLFEGYRQGLVRWSSWD